MNTRWKPEPIRSSDITPEAVYLNRRQFMKGAAVVTAGALLAASAPKAAPAPEPTEVATYTGQKDEFGSPLTAYEAVTGYNNYYEFTADKEGVAPLAQNFKTRPWTVEIGGLVNKPRTYDIDELGEIDLTNHCRPGAKQLLSVRVTALALKGVLLSYTDSASARAVRGSVARRGLCGDAIWSSSRRRRGSRM